MERVEDPLDYDDLWDWDEAEEDPTGCPSCDGQLVPLGQLGNLFWGRCRDCGCESFIEV